MSSFHFNSYDDQQLTLLRKKLRRWFRSHGRSLPWRETASPYHIWVSEIMLQQTTVKAVIPYYERFLRRFPTVSDLAAASEEEVLQYWEGLGYYSRGRNLRKAAMMICKKFAGEIPSDLKELQSLPGIGRYTAGAIRSFGFDKPAPIVEANTLRLYCRLMNYMGDPRGREGENLLWVLAEQLQPQRNAGIINQSLMEIGSQVCTPISPSCDACPLSEFCLAFQNNSQDEVPLKKERAKPTQLVEASIAVRNGERYLIRQRQPGERWAGLWDFPRFSIESIQYNSKITRIKSSRILQEVETQFFNQEQFILSEPRTVSEVKHTVTRYRIRLLLITATCEPPQVITEDTPERWATLEEIAELPMPVTGRQFAELLSTADD